MDLEFLYQQLPWAKDYPVIISIAAVILLLLSAYVVKLLAKKIFFRIAQIFYRRFFKSGQNLLGKYNLFTTLADYAALLVVHYGILLVPYCPPAVTDLVQLLCKAATILITSVIMVKLLKIFNQVYAAKKKNQRASLRSFIQLLQILIYVICALVIVGVFLHKDIFNLLAGLGALTAVFMLVFQNTILSFVASIQVSTYDMVRLGDWIEMPSFNANGNVIDISLHTITVQNQDKTITVIPTNRIITDNFKNWRGMTEAGVRRIKRSVLIDQTTVHFASNKELATWRTLPHIAQYLTTIDRAADNSTAAARPLTNLGVLRVYMLDYIRTHAGINADMTTIVRYLEPTNYGIPLEIYCFSTHTETPLYEATQADIFEHLLAVLPRFGLKVGQSQTA